MTEFTSLETATADDWAEIEKPHHAIAEQMYVAQQFEDLIRRQLYAPSFGWPINAAQHGLQAATRAYEASENDEVVFAALMHDATEILDPDNHAISAAQLIRPYVSDQVAWMVEYHGIFQDYHCKNHADRFSNRREQFVDHEAYDLTVRFCRDYDQNSFDGAFSSRNLDFFVPLIRRMVAAR